MKNKSKNISAKKPKGRKSKSAPKRKLSKFNGGMNAQKRTGRWGVHSPQPVRDEQVNPAG